MGLPRGKKGNNAIWVIVDRLTKSILFLPMKMIGSLDKLATLYMIWAYFIQIMLIMNQKVRNFIVLTKFKQSFSI
jgi:hypothetical protein